MADLLVSDQHVFVGDAHGDVHVAHHFVKSEWLRDTSRPYRMICQAEIVGTWIAVTRVSGRLCEVCRFLSPVTEVSEA